MTKVYPNAGGVWERQKAWKDEGSAVVVLTVWSKSLLPNCNGFTVFDCQGNLVFRVDNYIAGNKEEILLMDGAGTPLLTIRHTGHKMLRGSEKWIVFEGGESELKPLFTARKHGKNKCLVHYGGSESSSSRKKKKKKKKEIALLAYEMEGSYPQRCCTIYDNNSKKVAEIKKKEGVAGSGIAFGADVFRLIVQPHMDTTLAMAFLLILHHIHHN